MRLVQPKDLKEEKNHEMKNDIYEQVTQEQKQLKKYLK
jgi:hypothetical protein